MIIKRGSNWYRPYCIELSTGVYDVDDIIFYNDDGIICNTDCGWLSKGINGYSEDDITSIELPVDSIRLRRKLKFDGEVFAMTHKEEFGNKTKATLYIPANMLNIKFDKYYISLDILWASYIGDNGIKISQVIKHLTGKMNELRGAYDVESTQVETYHLHGRMNDIDEIIEHLSKMLDLAKAVKDERERLDNMTVEEALEE